MKRSDKIKLKFFLINIAKGIAVLGLLLVFYRILINYVDINNIKGFSYLEDLSTAFVFTIFFFSEVIFGIIPPEFFMIWVLNNKGVDMYPLFIIALSTISYFAGIFAFPPTGWPTLKTPVLDTVEMVVDPEVRVTDPTVLAPA